jgi:hypothetical protein
MADINFLSDNNNGREEKDEGNKKTEQEIEWTRPSKEKIVSSPISAGKNNGKKKSGWFSFAKKETPSVDSGKEDALDKFLDRDRIRKSRAEVLKLIKEKESAQIKEKKIKIKKQIDFFWFKNLFKRKEKSEKKIKEEKKEEIFPTILPKQIIKEKKSEPLPIKHEAKKEKIKRPNWIDKFLNSWRVFLANRRKVAIKKETPLPAPKPAKQPAHIKEDNNFKIKKQSWLDGLIESWRTFLAKREKDILKKEPVIFTKKQPAEIKASAPLIPKKEEKKEGEIEDEKFEEKETEEWENPKLLETNLIKGELTAFFNWKKGVALLSIYIFAAGLIIAAIYGGLVFWGEKKKGAEIVISDKLDALNSKIKPLEEEAEKIIITQKRIAAAAGLLTGHIYWNNFFKFLEDNTLAEVYYLGGFSGDNKGEYSLSASANDFRSILEQVNLLRANEYVSDVSVNGGDVSVLTIPGEDGKPESERVIQGVDFTLKIKIKPDLFIKYLKLENNLR